ncbi:MAG: hypothetical protein ACO1NX_04550 [Chitinophagaceae bacterium]
MQKSSSHAAAAQPAVSPFTQLLSRYVTILPYIQPLFEPFKNN